MPAFEFMIHQKTVVCTTCGEIFATPVNQNLPDMTKTSPVEADLHRILPHGAPRASMVAICPSCHYAWWASTFAGHFTLPVGIATSPAIEHPRKFAHAVLTGRQNNHHVLDRAMLALSGYWCAQECHNQENKWLILAIQELTAALAEHNWDGNRARYHYILGELLRKNSDFAAAIAQFDLVDESANLPIELIDRQKQLAKQQKNHPVMLTNEQVEKIFFPPLHVDLPPEVFAAQAVEEFEKLVSHEEAPLLPVDPLPTRKQKLVAPWANVQTVDTVAR